MKYVQKLAKKHAAAFMDRNPVVVYGQSTVVFFSQNSRSVCEIQKCFTLLQFCSSSKINLFKIIPQLEKNIFEVTKPKGLCGDFAQCRGAGATKSHFI